jgi:signal transduction histidine kinase
LKYFFIILTVVVAFTEAAAMPSDTTSLKLLYDRVIGFSEEKLDSIKWYARFIEEESAAIGFSKGKILAIRLKGVHSDLTGNYEEAIGFFLYTLYAARDEHYVEYEISALSDLSIVYTEIKQPEKAKEVYLECLHLTEKTREKAELITGYGNIGAIYNMLNNTDSALYYLAAARRLCEAYNAVESLPFIYNNTGNTYFKRKDYARALEYFRLNENLHRTEQHDADLWVDYLNMGDCYIELKMYDSATKYCQTALDIAVSLQSKSKEADAYALMAKLYERLGQFKKALEFHKTWYTMDTALVNANSSRTIAEMQEKFHSRDRDKQNQLLTAQVGQEKLRNRYLRYQIIGAIVIGLLVGSLLLVYRKANLKLKEVNKVIVRQKEKLTALNQEKNALISIVSHDLSSPFASIAMWSNLIGNEENLKPDQKNALSKIRDSALHGENLIRRILDIERRGTSAVELELEETNLTELVIHIISDYTAAASAKLITLHPPEQKLVYLMTDQALMRRILENLLSNAIKFSAAGKNVWVAIEETDHKVEVSVTDEGEGIAEADKKLLFTKYAQLNAKPTGGENSSGLGLSIVKRLVNELNGAIFFSSELGQGSSFRIQFEK